QRLRTESAPEPHGTWRGLLDDGVTLPFDGLPASVASHRDWGRQDTRRARHHGGRQGRTIEPVHAAPGLHGRALDLDGRPGTRYRLTDPDPSSQPLGMQGI